MYKFQVLSLVLKLSSWVDYLKDINITLNSFILWYKTLWNIQTHPFKKLILLENNINHIL